MSNRKLDGDGLPVRVRGSLLPPAILSGVRNGFALVGMFAAVYMGLAALDAAGILQRAEAQTEPVPPVQEVVHTAKRLSDESAGELAPVAVRAHHDPRQKPLARHIARTYRIAEDAADRLVATSFDAAKAYALDPILILAVMAIESRFNPIAESEMGAKGLMQVMSKVHFDKLDPHGGAEMVLDPRTNILVGAQILRECIDRAGGLEAGLQWYNGAPNDPQRPYADKVLGEYDRLAALVGRPRAPRGATPRPAADGGEHAAVPETKPAGVPQDIAST